MLNQFGNLLRDTGTFFYNVPITKILYTVAIIAIVVFFTRDLVSLWGRKTIFLGNFDYYGQGKSSIDTANQLRSETVYFYKTFGTIIVSEIEKRRSELSDLAKNLAKDEEFELTRWVKGADKFTTDRVYDLSHLELSIQGFNIQKIFTFLTNIMARSEEVTANIRNDGSAIHVLLNYPNSLAARLDSPPRADLTSIDTDTEAAKRIACFLIWVQSDDENSRFSGVAFDEFCQWMKAIHLKWLAVSTSGGYFADRAFVRNASFSREFAKRAFSGQFTYDQAYLAAADLADLDNDGLIELNSSVAVKSAHISAYLRHIYLWRSRAGLTADVAKLYSLLSSERTLKIDSALDLGTAIFRYKSGKACDRAEIFKNTDTMQRLVRLSWKTISGGIDEMTGLVISPGTVVVPWRPRIVGAIKRGRPTAKIETVNCKGKVIEHQIAGHKIVEVGQKAPLDFNKLIVLNVKGLGQSLSALSKDTASSDFKTYEGQEITSVGFSYKFTELFRKPLLKPPSMEIGKGAVDDNIYYTRGYILFAAQDSSWNEGGKYLMNDAPLPVGMQGSPLITRDGDIIGIQMRAHYRAGWLPLSVAIPLTHILDAAGKEPVDEAGEELVE